MLGILLLAWYSIPTTTFDYFIIWIDEKNNKWEYLNMQNVQEQYKNETILSIYTNNLNHDSSHQFIYGLFIYLMKCKQLWLQFNKMIKLIH